MKKKQQKKPRRWWLVVDKEGYPGEAFRKREVARAWYSPSLGERIIRVEEIVSKPRGKR